MFGGFSSQFTQAQQVDADPPQPVVFSEPVATPVAVDTRPVDPVTLAVEIRTPSHSEINAQLRQRAAEYFTASEQRKAQMEQRAAARGYPRQIKVRGGSAATLIDLTEGGRPIYVQPHNIAAADSIGVDELWPANSVTAIAGWPTGSTGRNLNGAGVTVGMWEANSFTGGAGVRTAHGQFGGRVTQADSTPLSDHATQVAGTIGAGGINAFANIGDPPSTFNIGNHSRGMAYACNIRARNVPGLPGELNLEAANGLRISNHSYGQAAGWLSTGTIWLWLGNGSALQDWQFGAYVGVDPFGNGVAPRELDTSAAGAPYCLMVYSAGNEASDGPGQPVTYYIPGNPNPQTTTRDWDDGDAGRYDTLPPSACAKNVLTVGAVYDLIDGHTAAAANITLAPFSSFGPTDDGRIKPDVVACGIRTGGIGGRNPLGFPGLITPTYEPTHPNDDYYTAIAVGTSFSAPSVSGALALVLQRRHQLQPGWGALSFGWPIRSSTQRGLAVHTAREAGPAAGPDFRFGYGLFDAVAAVNLMGADAGAPERRL